MIESGEKTGKRGGLLCAFEAQVTRRSQTLNSARGALDGNAHFGREGGREGGKRREGGRGVLSVYLDM